jgi:beta-lactamase superfamily II metal-dependent hydrolase
LRREIDMLKVTMLPAAYGDALWIEYGTPASLRCMLIDAGPASTYDQLRAHLAARPKRQRRLELFVISHIDTDHIDGAIMLLQDDQLGIEFGDVWFNGWKQLGTEPEREVYGPEQGEFVNALLQLGHRPWNKAFGGAALVVPPAGKLPRASLPGGLTLTLLSPGERQLRRLRRNWESVISDAGWNPGDPTAALRRLRERRDYHIVTRQDTFEEPSFGTDNAVANGSSIALMLEYKNRLCLLTGDAHPDALVEGLDRYMREQNTAGQSLNLDLVKLPHHGSQRNWEPELQTRLRARHYLVSTNGDKFRHPDRATIDAITEGHGKATIDLWFNYQTPTTTIWADRALQKAKKYVAHYPKQGTGVTVDLV